MWSPSSGTELDVLHTQGIDFTASCANALSCSGVLEGGPTPGAVITAGASSVHLRVAPPVDWFEPSHIWVWGREEPIIGWPLEPLPAEPTFYRAPRDYIQQRVLRCTAQVRDELGQITTVTAEYPITVRFDHSPGRDRTVQEVLYASSGAAG